MDHLKITKDTLDVSTISDLVADDTCGAISLFVGTTRNNCDNKNVISLEYESYNSMAMKEMQGICKELRTKYNDIVNIAIYHRIGLVPVKQASVVIAISSPHRQTSLDAVALAIEELKRRVPIWKKEIYENEESTWKENKEYTTKVVTQTRNLDACFYKKRRLSSDIDKNLIQVQTNGKEMQNRIDSFIAKKRNDNNVQNIMDYIPKANENNGNFSCARIDSLLIKQKDSKYHLKVRQVKNETGPQVKPDYRKTLNKLMTNLQKEEEESSPATNQPIRAIDDALNERLKNIEEYFEMDGQAVKNVYQRINDIENRILNLESISPEYKHFSTNLQHGTVHDPNPTTRIPNMTSKRPTFYTASEIEAMIKQAELHAED